VSAAAVVINHNGGEDLGACLAALARQSVAVQVVLVDNASTDSSRRFLDHPPPGVVVVRLPENRGYAGGANAGLRACPQEAEAVGFFNPDCLPEPDFFQVCLAVLRENPRVGGVAPRLLRPDRAVLDSCGQVLTPWVLMVRDRGYGEPAAGAFTEAAHVLAACGAGMVYRREALEQVRLEGEVFPEEFFAFWEDLDLGWRVCNAGFSVRYEPRAVALHRRGATAAPGRGRLMFRRPPEVAARILLNRWATLLRNLHPRDAWWRLPALLVWDAAMVLALALRKPQALRFLREAPGRLFLALRQRRLLRRRPLGELVP
jgi:GT2 family glycosyltransferase